MKLLRNIVPAVARINSPRGGDSNAVTIAPNFYCAKLEHETARTSNQQKFRSHKIQHLFKIGDMMKVTLLYWMSLLGLLSCWMMITSSANLTSTIWTVDPNERMPTVFVLPSRHAKQLSKTECDNFVNARDIYIHSNDILFYCFIVHHYPCTITTVPTNDSVTVDLFFYYITGFHKPQAVWDKYDDFLHEFTMKNPLSHEVDFTLDKTFCVDSHPVETIPLHQLNWWLRYVQDIHHFRSDYMLTPNGRDVFIPYVVKRPANSSYLFSNENLLERRKHVFMAPLRECPGVAEPYRLYRSRLHSYLQTLHLDKALISNNMASAEFDKGMETSIFCLILPGDTPSTAKLYKSIFRGCIPVIFVSYPAQLPFYQFIDWYSFSLIFYKDDINYPHKIDRIVETMYNMSRNVDELKRMRISLAKHAVLFDYGRRDWPSVYHLSLLSLQAMISNGNKLVAA
eukprot:scaffold1345_cov173-Ochromonas_danica.AAC.12